MKITLVGMGSGLPGSLTAQGLQALQTAGLILGAKRLLQNLPDGCTPNRKPIYQPDEVLACLQAEPCQTAALVYSGDTGFYSGAAALVPKLRAQGAEVTVLPGISSVQLWPRRWAGRGRTGTLSAPTDVPAPLRQSAGATARPFF